jgi:[protein-PII] uridylyltransferase
MSTPCSAWAQLDTICKRASGAVGPLSRRGPKNSNNPFLLYLALLLHDSGKTGTRRRATPAPEPSSRCAWRGALTWTAPPRTPCVCWSSIICSWAHVSQRRDLEDQGVVRQFAGTLQSPENLRMLTLLTYADTMATSDKLWNGFKDSLLWQTASQRP